MNLTWVDSLKVRMDELLTCAEDCFAQRRFLPGLILVYSAMDILASLDRPPHKREAGRQGFIDWVNTYLLPGSKLACSAEDLYGARCGLLHTYSAESQHTHEGKARQVFYGWGTAKVEELKAATEITSFKDRAVTVHVDDLLVALKSGFQKLMHEVVSDPVRGERVKQRAAKIFGPVPVDLVAEAARIAREREGKRV